jgi:GNAT superfamily N-acetyltransferase
MTASTNQEPNLRLLTPDDLPECLRLTTLCGWNQTEGDWRRFLALAPEGCFGVEVAGRLAGTTTVLSYGSALAWIGMVIVDPAFRRRGLGRGLMDAALARAEGCAAVGLDATPMGQPLYEQLGFVAAFTLDRTVAPSLPPLTPEPGSAARLTPADLAALVTLDAAVTGAERPALLADLLATAPDLAWGVRRSGELSGFCLGRFGSRFAYLGPVIAPDADQAWALLQGAAQGLTGQPLALDVPREQTAWRKRLAGAGFAAERPLVRMYLRGLAPPRDLARLFALAGGELG